MELPVKQEAFKCWLESYGIACGNILGEVKHRGQHFKTFHVKVLSRQSLQVFLVLLVCFNCNVLWLEIKPCKQYQLHQCWLHLSSPKSWNLNNFFFVAVHSFSYHNRESVLEQNKSMKVHCFIQTTYHTKITSFFYFFYFAALSEWRPQALSCSVYANSKGRTGPSDSVAWVDVTRTWPWQQWKPGWAIVTRRLHPSSVWNILR